MPPRNVQRASFSGVVRIAGLQARQQPPGGTSQKQRRGGSSEAAPVVAVASESRVSKAPRMARMLKITLSRVRGRATGPRRGDIPHTKEVRSTAGAPTPVLHELRARSATLTSHTWVKDPAWYLETRHRPRGSVFGTRRSTGSDCRRAREAARIIAPSSPPVHSRALPPLDRGSAWRNPGRHNPCRPV